MLFQEVYVIYSLGLENLNYVEGVCVCVEGGGRKEPVQTESLVAAKDSGARKQRACSVILQTEKTDKN